jgi:aryl sulfotransferase
MGVLGWIGVMVATLIGFLVIQGIYLSTVLRWETDQTLGLGYYGRSLAERRAFKTQLKRHARLLSPIIRLSRASPFDFRKLSFRYDGIAAPHGSTSPESFQRARDYRPRAEDVFVVTQMKCGTTWMQYLVYEVLHRGQGTLAETGTALYAIAPWLEGLKSVSLDQAPTVGTERPSRIVKTHLPAELCPDSDQARYIYVARHPASCFASCVDFITTNTGGMHPGMAQFEDWFRSPELMWWGTWPAHVKGWWDRAGRRPNVLLVHFEEMKRDLPAVTKRVAEFLGVRALEERELARVVEKAGFDFMQRHQEMFEMFPPHILQTSGELLIRGTANRHDDVPVEVRNRIIAWAKEETGGSAFGWPYGDEGTKAGR